MGIIPHIKGRKRWRLVAQHRLYEFERVFDRYRDGKTSAEHVASRGRKLTASKKARPKRYSRKKQERYR